MDPSASQTTAISAAQAALELQRLLQAPAFAAAPAHRRLLEYLVQRELAGDLAALKETVLGITVFRRPSASFDPRRDSIVRVEARRLRERLRQHYAHDASSDWMVVLPKGSYRPQWVARPADGPRAQAAELVERGSFFLRQGHEDGHRKALERFEAAVRVQPTLAAAHSGVARAWLQLVATNLEPPRPGVDLALAAVRQALALQPAHADSLVLAAQLTHRFEFDWPAARVLFERAAQVQPGGAYIHHAHALSLMMRGEFAAAEAELAQARRADPLHLSLRAHQALLHLYRRQWDAAEDALQALLDLSADNVLGMSLLAYVALCRGDAAAALAQYREVERRHPQLSIGAVGQAQALAALGDAAAARAVQARLNAAPTARYLSPYQLAMVALRLDDAEAALALLQRAVDERDPNALCLPVDPAFDALHASPRFATLRAQVLGAVVRGVQVNPAAPGRAAAAASTP